jgi:hypothetical protein
MSKFVFLGEDYVNLDHVKMVTRQEYVSGAAKTIVRFTDGTSESYDGTYFDEIDTPSKVIVPAQPGFEQLAYWFTDEEPTAAEILGLSCRQPILAWRLDGDGYLIPHPFVLEPDMPEYVQGCSAILRPDGVVVQPRSGWWLSASAWAEHVRDKWRKWRDEQALKAAPKAVQS